LCNKYTLTGNTKQPITLTMNIQQLEYIVAVDNYRHFAKASEKSFVTQPTLSTMIQKLEEELAVKIFDRTKPPVVPTREGKEVIRRAKLILHEVSGLRNFAIGLKDDTGGELRLGIIPTLAPYLLPLFLGSFRDINPSLVLFVKEMLTVDIIAGLRTGELDMGLLATPLDEDGLTEHNIFYEELVAYASSCSVLCTDGRPLDPEDIDVDKLWLIEEGHCLRNQVLSLVELKRKASKNNTVRYQAGSIETLINLVDNHQGLTIIPELATINLNSLQKGKVRRFEDPRPVREISLVVAATYPRKKLLKQIREEILTRVPIETNADDKRVLKVKFEEE
jgi:LysR family hydrogen peroxide-inducible transcriptional activator